MLRTRAKFDAELAGFIDALEIGRPNPINMPDWERVAYDKGFARGKRAEARLKAPND